ncbi:hypothetical protein AB205_0055610 [Aquarana catesbeiana]|uniref:Uncharacterized protein n=1 Tax=Aquarana catesbeiana TaxID=8400 RepID=A0A2G9SKV5_AQUCT|nr:hypothetical protein AB205_0055610 [Aquarana catesbeiana]
MMSSLCSPACRLPDWPAAHSQAHRAAQLPPSLTRPLTDLAAALSPMPEAEPPALSPAAEPPTHRTVTRQSRPHCHPQRSRPHTALSPMVGAARTVTRGRAAAARTVCHLHSRRGQLPRCPPPGSAPGVIFSPLMTYHALLCTVSVWRWPSW